LEADVSEQAFRLTVGSPEEFVGLMERYSAPIMLATQTLGERWPSARADLLAAVEAAGGPDEGEDGGASSSRCPTGSPLAPSKLTDDPALA
jgi:hypothetical protein